MAGSQNIAGSVSDSEVFQWVTFQLDRETYGVNVKQVREVLRYTDIAPVPGAPRYVLGIINLRGNVVTIIDTRLRFGLESTDITDNTRIVIIEAETQTVGILVDSVAEVVYLKSSEIDVAPSVGTDESAKFIQGVCNRDDDLLILVDLNKLLTDEEWAVVLLVCWVVYLHMSISQIRKTLFSVSDNFNDIDSVINMVHGFGKRWDYVTKAISDLQMSQEQSSVQHTGDPQEIEALIARIEELEHRLEELQMMDPESKMYNRAVKMVKAGSSIEEVMDECELPRSEAQLLFSIHGRNS